MWRSLINSVRGRSALATPSSYEYPPLAPTDTLIRAAARPRVTSRPSPAAPSSPPPPIAHVVSKPVGITNSAVIASADAPRACCVHCGHPLFVPPKAQHVRCPKCSSDLPARDIELTGDVADEQILTAGKITVAPDARVHARLVACSVDIAGMVLGTVLASHTCRLRPTAKLAGNLLCRRLAMDSGAQVEGSVELIRS